MMIDSAFIMIYLRRFVLSEFDRRIAHSPAIAGRTLSLRPQRSRLAYNLLPCTTFRHDQNLTSTARFSRFSFLRRSGVHPGTVEPSGPVFPPGGVTPPRP